MIGQIARTDFSYRHLFLSGMRLMQLQERVRQIQPTLRGAYRQTLRANASPPSRSRFRPAPMTPRGRMRRNCAMPSYFTVPHSAAGAFASPTKSNLWALLEVDGKDRLASSNMPQSPSVS